MSALISVTWTCPLSVVGGRFDGSSWSSCTRPAMVTWPTGTSGIVTPVLTSRNGTEPRSTNRVWPVVSRNGSTTSEMGWPAESCRSRTSTWPGLIEGAGRGHHVPQRRLRRLPRRRHQVQHRGRRGAERGRDRRVLRGTFGVAVELPGSEQEEAGAGERQRGQDHRDPAGPRQERQAPDHARPPGRRSRHRTIIDPARPAGAGSPRRPRASPPRSSPAPRRIPGAGRSTGR